MATYDMSTLRYGDKGTQVRALQKLMNIEIAAGLEVDGIFGVKTQAAVKVVQKKYGLTQDGVPGPKTWPYLVDGIAASTSSSATSTASNTPLALAAKWMPTVYNKIVELGCAHKSGATGYEQIISKKITTCSASVSAVLQKAGVLPSGKLVSHTSADGKSGSTKTTIAKAISGYGNLIAGTYDIVRIGKTYANMSSAYKKAGIVYVQDSNICMCAGDGSIYSTNEGSIQYKNGKYVKDKVSSGYPFTSQILYAIVPKA